MKRIVSVSLGSSKRDHVATVTVLGEQVRIERIGTGGDIKRVVELIRELDGKVDAFGMGGIDLYLWAGKKRYVLRDGLRIARAPRKTPIVDGSGVKNTLERRVIRYLRDRAGIPLAGKRVLLVCAMDRFGMAEALIESGSKVLYGDFGFALGLAIPLWSLKTVHRIAAILVPVVSRLPFKYLYPVGEVQERIRPKFRAWYEWAEIVAGDCHYIKRHMPESLRGKLIVTNTVTRDDVDAFRRRGVATLVTTTPELDGRSFGTNVMEALLVSFSDKPLQSLEASDYERLLDRMGFEPRIERLA